MSNNRVLLLLVAMATTAFSPVRAESPPLQQSNIVEHVGAAVPRDLTFTDSSGRTVTFGSFVGDVPLIVSLAYFTCPMLCHLGQDTLADALRDSGWQVGRDVRLVTVSVDPRDEPAMARDWRARAATHLRVAPDQMDWAYLVGGERNIGRLAEVLGFEYVYDPKTGQYLHAAAAFVVTPDGHISRYVYGITPDPRLLDAALTAARQNTGGGPFERFLMRCFHYVPSIRRHGTFVTWMLRTGGAIVSVTLAGLLVVLWRRDGRSSTAGAGDTRR